MKGKLLTAAKKLQVVKPDSNGFEKAFSVTRDAGAEEDELRDRRLKRGRGDSGRRKGYDPNQFYPYSRDAKGHSQPFRVDVPDGELNEMWEIVNASQGIYRTPQDFVRDAIVHRAKYLGEMFSEGGPEFQAVCREWGDLKGREAEVARVRAKLKQSENFYISICETFEECRKLPILSQMVRALEEAKDALEILDSPLKEKLEDEVKRFEDDVERARK